MPGDKKLQKPSHFRHSLLPKPVGYFAAHGIKLFGTGIWKSALCPFHNDNTPSLRINIETGGFRCMACGQHGGDILAFHMQHYGLRFNEAARQLGAWVDA